MAHVMHISSSLQLGGLERLIHNFAAKLNPNAYQFSACALDRDGIFGDEIRKIGCSVKVLGRREGLDVSLWPKLYRIFVKEKVDIVHTHNFSPLLYAAIPARLAGVKVLVHTEHARTAFPDTHRRMITERFLSFFVDKVTAVSPQVKRDLIFHEKIGAAKIQMIWNGIDTNVRELSRQPNEVRAEFGLRKNSPVVGVCCRLNEQKGVRYLLEAVPSILKVHPQAVFLIVGDGDLKASLHGLTKSLGLQDNVIFAGFRSDIYELLQIFDIYVLPSLFEGTPLGLLEAMLLSRCAVITKVGSNAEIVQHGVSAMLVEPRRPDQLADAINELLFNSERRQQMGQKARQQVLSMFSLERMIHEYEALYETLLQRNAIKTME